MVQNYRQNINLMFLKQLAKHIILFTIFGTIYFVIECIWKGQLSHWSMFVLAGIIGILIGGINEYIPWEMPFWQQCGIGMIFATIGEGITGLIVNTYLHLNVWHYNILPFFWGQCSVPFCIAWFFLAGLCIILDDWIRYRWFGESKPHYI